MMRLDVATADDIRAVARDMRDSDLAEFSAVLPVDDRDAVADTLSLRYGYRPDILCAQRDGRRIAIGGALELRPNVLTLLFFATPDFGQIALPLTRFIKLGLFRRLVAAGVHRIEAVSMDGHTQAHRWIEALGLSRETGPLRGYGKRGEAFIQFAWVRP